jgi:hypothetical protein
MSTSRQNRADARTQVGTYDNPYKYDDGTNATEDRYFRIQLLRGMGFRKDTEKGQMLTAKPMLCPCVRHEIQGLRLS